MPTMLGTIVILLLLTFSSATTANKPEFLNSLNIFSQNLFSEILQSSGQKSIIYSPFSIQTSLAMTRMGADGQTADEMDHGLAFAGQTPESVANDYHTLLEKYENSSILKFANKIYLKKGYELQDNYKELLSRKFFSSAEDMDFSKSEKAADAINSWVELRTNHTIKNLVSPDLLNDNVRFLLLSAINFKGKWVNAFSKENTTIQDFYTTDTTTIKVPMMYRSGLFDYGIDHELNANVLRLPYQDSDLSMVILLPRSRLSLADFKDRLKNFQFQSWRGKKIYWPNECCVYMPKFRAEFDMELKDTLKKMGMNKMFADADFGKLAKSSQPLYVSEVVHKAVIEVTEEGTEAAAATDIEGLNRLESLMVRIDRPFVYAIINEDFVPFFQGTFYGL